MEKTAHDFVKQLGEGDYSGPLGTLVQKIKTFSMVTGIRTENGSIIIEGLKNWGIHPTHNNHNNIEEALTSLAKKPIHVLEERFRC